MTECSDPVLQTFELLGLGGPRKNSKRQALLELGRATSDHSSPAAGR